MTNSPRVFLIDDDPLLHDAVKMILAPLGYRVDGRLTGPKGLEALRADPPDLVLLDVMLATPSEGFHLLYQMRQDPRLRSIPVIVLSAVGHAFGLDFAKEVGGDFLPAERFLEKPITAQALRDAVHSALAATEGRT